MRGILIASALILIGSGRILASTDTVHASAPTEDEAGPQGESDLSEQMGIIPKSAGVLISTQPVTPVSEFPDRNLYDQALAEYEQANTLYKNRDYEAASDLSLQAYDDLNLIHIRRPKKKRAKLRAQKYQIATLYMQTSVLYIKNFVKEAGGTPAAFEEGKARLR